MLEVSTLFAVYGLFVAAVAWQIVTLADVGVGVGEVDVGVGLAEVSVGVGVGEAAGTAQPAFQIAWPAEVQL